MGIRKLCLTKKITVTTSEKLYSEIEQVCKNSMHFATISEYTAYAMEYFIDRFIDDVAPYVVEEQKKRLEDNTYMERMEFASDYSGATTSWQATIPLGLLFQFNSIQNIFHTLDPTNMIRYSVEYYLNCIRRKDGLIAILLNNMPLPEERPLPEIKFKELKSDKS